MYIISLDKIGKNDTHLAGGKGSSLGAMKKFGIQVPGGFVVTSKSFQSFLSENNLKARIGDIMSKVDYSNFASLTSTSSIIYQLFMKGTFSVELSRQVLEAFKELNADYVAVRSSAILEDSSTVSWAGELETFLNVDKENLCVSIKKCWASLYTARAIKYAKENKINQVENSVAVVVQEMVGAEVAGVCFTTHPVTQDKNMVNIEAAWGLGEAVVSGVITPDNYVVSKRDLIIEVLKIGKQTKQIVRQGNKTRWIKVQKRDVNKQKLAGIKIIELTKMALRIEKFYKKPQDIEWVFKKGNFYIVQSRPITTLF